MASYYVWSGATGTGTGASWANAFTTLVTAFVTEVAGDTLYVAHDHVESAANLTLASSGSVSNPTKVICVNRAGSVPPVSADRRATATASSTTNSNLTITGCTHYDGIIFTAGAGSSSSANLGLLDTDLHWLRFDNCSLRLGITAGASAIFFGGFASTLGATYVELNNTTISCAATTHLIRIGSTIRWRNTPSALLGTIPSTIFTPVFRQGGSVDCAGIDLSAAGSGKTICSAASQGQSNRFKFLDCKLDAAVTRSTSFSGNVEVDFVRSGASGVNYTVYSQRITGTLTEETIIVRTGGASDGTTTLAWKIVTTSNSFYSLPFECPPIAIWNDTTGSSVTATVEGIWGGGAVPNDDDVWIDVEYLGDAASPQASFVNDGKADLLATAAGQTTSSATWGGSTTKFKLNVSFTAQQKGWIYCRVKCAKASSTFYVDPLVTLT